MSEGSAFKRGLEGFSSAAERAKRGGGDYVDFEWFRWKDGETKILRFLTDLPDIVNVIEHSNVLCHDGKRRPMICRDQGRGACELCLLMEQSRDEKGKATVARSREVLYGMAVLRLEHVGENGKVDGYMDATMDYVDDESGETKKRPIVGIVKQGYTNFWHQPLAFYEKWGTLRDRDYDVQRRGGDLDTQYVMIANDPVEIPNIDERYAKFLPDLEGVLERMSSQEYYDRHLRGASSSSDEAPAAEAAPQPEGQGDQVAAPLPDEDSEFARLKAEREALESAAVSGTYD